jgi:hypothetical protein
LRNAPIQTEYDHAAGAERRIDVAQNPTVTTSYAYELAGSTSI